MDINELKDKHAKALEKAKAIQAGADAADRELTEDEANKVDELFANADELAGKIDAAKKADARKRRLEGIDNELEDLNEPEPTKAAADQPLDPNDIKGGDFRNDDKKAHGFKHFGEMAAAVKKWAVDKESDQRLFAAPTTYSTGGVGADGGFLVYPDARNEIMRHVLSQPSLMERCRRLTTTSDSLEMPIDKTTPWGSDGIQAYWVDSDEAEQITQSKAKLGKTTVKMHDLAVLAPVTNNLLSDAGAGVLGQYLTQAAGDRIRWKVDNAILNGTGSGQPLGVRNSAALKQVTRVTATGIGFDEVGGLMGALPAASKSRATFVGHTTIYNDLITQKIGESDSPAFIPVGGAGQEASLPRLLGRPYLEHEAAQARDNAGDLSLHDFTQYMLLTKNETDQIQADMSIHLYFDYVQTAFRFVFRVGGQPWFDSTISQANGGGTLSPFAEIGAT